MTTDGITDRNLLAVLITVVLALFISTVRLAIKRFSFERDEPS